jgi:hypothetical protein
MKRPKAEQLIADLCRAAGCNEEQRLLHNEQFLKRRWHPHPPSLFRTWWQPTHIDPTSGASVGGHPDALRIWARPEETRGYAHGRYGIHTLVAWNMQYYRDQFNEWKHQGYPERATEFVSLSAPLSRQGEYWKRLEPIRQMIGRKPAEKAQIKAAFNVPEIIAGLDRDFPG